jgi:hypothetical protein
VLLSQQSSKQLQQNHHQMSAHPEPVQTLNKRKTKLETKKMLCSLRSLPPFSQLITYFNLDSSSGMPQFRLNVQIDLFGLIAAVLISSLAIHLSRRLASRLWLRPQLHGDIIRINKTFRLTRGNEPRLVEVND